MSAVQSRVPDFKHFSSVFLSLSPQEQELSCTLARGVTFVWGLFVCFLINFNFISINGSSLRFPPLLSSAWVPERLPLFVPFFMQLRL